MVGAEWVGPVGLSMIVLTEEILLGQARGIVPLKEVPPPQMAEETVVLDASVEVRKSSLQQWVVTQQSVVAFVEGERKSSFPQQVYIL